MRTLLFTVVLFAFPAFAYSSTWYVPDDYSTIQTALDNVADGDTIIVRPGTYQENITIEGDRAITLKSQNGASATVIRGQGGIVVKFLDATSKLRVLKGFTVINVSGSGISCEGGTNNRIINNIIKNNHSGGDGPGISFIWGASGTVSYNIIKENIGLNGGGIACTGSGSNPLISYNTIDDNRAQAVGGIYVNYGACPRIENNTIINNYVCDINCCGGGIGAFDMPAGGTIINNCIDNNYGASDGGGILLYQSSPLIKNNKIRNNSCTQDGGGIYVGSSSNADVVSNVITHNVAGRYGGGLRCYPNYSGTVTGNTLSYNQSTDSGGGVFFSKASGATVASNLISYNTSTDNDGGGLYLSLCNGCQLVNNTIVKNTADGSGGGMYVYFNTATVSNTIFWGNEAVSPGDEIYIDGATLNISFSDVEHGQGEIHVFDGILNWGAGMIDQWPNFIYLQENDCHLEYDSPCKNAGVNSTVTELYDYEGDPRIAYGTVDIGADEWHNHLYCTGDFTPNGSIDAYFIGLPGTWPVGLFIGSGIMDPPLQHAWGDFYLDSPWFLFPLIPIPAQGRLVIQAILPATPAPYDIPMQALIGLNSNGLTNLFVLEVR